MESSTEQIMHMLKMLPEHEQDFACEILKRIVLAWDPDYTKLTTEELKRLETGKNELANRECYDDCNIDWANLDDFKL